MGGGVVEGGRKGDVWRAPVAVWRPLFVLTLLLAGVRGLRCLRRPSYYTVAS